MYWFISVCFLLTILCLFLSVRIKIIANLRLALMRNAWDTFKKVPGFDAMTLHPKFYLLWTEAHWRAWVERQQSEAAR